MRTKRRGWIANACLLRAIGELLHDPDWAPEAVVDLIEHHDGYPLSALEILAGYAPLLIWRRSDLVELEVWEDRARIFDASRREQRLTSGEKIAVCFQNAEAQGHIEAVSLQELPFYFRYPIVAVLTSDPETASQWQYCACCAMVMPPLHGCSPTRMEQRFNFSSD